MAGRRAATPQCLTMAAFEAATQCVNVRERKGLFRRVDTRLLGGRVMPGHGE